MKYSDLTSHHLKQYCDYLIENYKMINPCYEDSKIYHKLNEFWNTGEVKGLIYKNTKRKIKGEWLGVMAQKINIFYADYEKTIKNYVRRKKLNKLMSCEK